MEDLLASTRTLLTERFRIVRGLWADCPEIRALAKSTGWCERTYCAAYLTKNFPPLQFPLMPLSEVGRLTATLNKIAEEAFQAAGQPKGQG